MNTKTEVDLVHLSVTRLSIDYFCHLTIFQKDCTNYNTQVLLLCIQYEFMDFITPTPTFSLKTFVLFTWLFQATLQSM